VLGRYPENPDITQDVTSEILWISIFFDIRSVISKEFAI
jgi:hypothetical protein